MLGVVSRCMLKLAKLMAAVSIVSNFLIPAVAAQPVREIVIGMTTSLQFLEGRESYDAVKLATEEINASGGVWVGKQRLPLRIEAFDLDDAGPLTTVNEAVERLERFIIEKHVHAIVVGPFRSEILLASLDILAQHKTLLLNAIAMSTAMEAKILSDPKYKYVFRVCLNAKYLVEYLIDTMKFLQQQHGFNKVYIMNQDVAWARTVASLMVKLYFDRADWKIVGLNHYAYGTTDFSTALQRAEDSGAHVILPLFDMPNSVVLVKQWNRLQEKPLLCGFVSSMVGPGAWRTFEGSITGTLNVIFELGNIPSTRWQPSVDFHKAFSQKYGRQIEAGHGPAPAYESVYILAEAIERAESLNPDKVVTALEATDRIGAMGRIRFHKGHQVVFGNDLDNDALACIIQWDRNGRRKIVYPLSIAEGEIELPHRTP
jgi:branched-chain amino acid transport system substrate-binding protein